ncbi:hypothetical protein QYF61_001792 [Mycteria americana]|uniref:Uncharacterized protein n=1 Tax=Mycteria americana TaxID=33587 RepID=A0AAN7NP57_MYCAM|nr:hypothetical protein QYF61_001792 [Mycteria americana]
MLFQNKSIVKRKGWQHKRNEQRQKRNGVMQGEGRGERDSKAKGGNEKEKERIGVRYAGLDAGCHLPRSAEHGIPMTTPSSPPALLGWELGNLSRRCRVPRDF